MNLQQIKRLRLTKVNVKFFDVFFKMLILTLSLVFTLEYILG